MRCTYRLSFGRCCAHAFAGIRLLQFLIDGWPVIKLGSIMSGRVREITGAGRVDNGAVAESVLQMMVRLLGPYRSFVRPGAGGANGLHPDFDEEGFVAEVGRPVLRSPVPPVAAGVRAAGCLAPEDNGPCA